MEDECHKLDMAIVSEEESILRGGSSYSHFVEDSEKAKRMKDELDRLVLPVKVCLTINKKQHVILGCGKRLFP